MFFFLLKGELDDEQHLRVFGRARKTSSPQEPVIENVIHGSQSEQAPEPVKAKKPKPKAAPKQAAPPDARPCAACGEPAAVVGKFNFTRTGKQVLCAPCVDLGFVFSPAGAVQQLQEQAA